MSVCSIMDSFSHPGQMQDALHHCSASCIGDWDRSTRVSGTWKLFALLLPCALDILFNLRQKWGSNRNHKHRFVPLGPVYARPTGMWLRSATETTLPRPWVKGRCWANHWQNGQNIQCSMCLGQFVEIKPLASLVLAWRLRWLAEDLRVSS